MTTFADISGHQEDPTPAADVDLAAYARAGHDRIALKATEATGYVNPWFARWWAQAGQLGLARVAYHYDRARFDGADQFDHFAAVVEAVGGLGARDRLCLDTEDTQYPSGAQTSAARFAARALQRSYPEGLVYTGRWFADPYGITAALFPAGWRKLWLSHYDTTVPDGQILMPSGWARSQCVARQYTDRAVVAGITGGCDCSRVLIDWIGADMAFTDADVQFLNDAAEAGKLDKLARRVMVMVRDQAGLATSAQAVQLAGGIRSLSDDEANIIAAVRAGDDVLSAAIAKVATTIDPASDPAAYARAVVAELGAAINRGEPA